MGDGPEVAAAAARDIVPLEIREKLKIPAPSIYDGKRDPDTLRRWLYDFDNYATFHTLRYQQRVALVPFYLSGSAATWWAARRAADEIPLTWNGITDIFKEEFLSKNYVNRLRTKLYNLKQTTSVAAYSIAFRQLLLNLPAMADDLVLHLYIQGLKPATRLEVEMKEPVDLNTAEVQALRVDDIRFNTGQRDTCPTQPPYQGKNPQFSLVPTQNINTQRPSNNPLPKLTDAERARLRSLGACFKCRQTGHLANQCPSRRNPNGHQPARRSLNVNVVDAVTATLPENGQRQ